MVISNKLYYTDAGLVAKQEEAMPNLLSNSSFETGHGHQDGIPELVMPNNWRLYFLDEVPFPGIGEDGTVAAKPESVVWNVNDAPAHEQPLFFLHGEFCLKVFKSYMPIYFAFTQHVKGLKPNSVYTLRMPVFPDLVMGYEGGQKVYADDDRAGGARAGYSEPNVNWPAGADEGVNWGPWHEKRYGNFEYGQYNVVEMDIPVGASGQVRIWLEVKAIWGLRNNGFFFDNFRLDGLVGPVVGPQVEMNAVDKGDGSYEVHITSPAALTYVDLELDDETVSLADAGQGGLGYEWVYPVQLPGHGRYEVAFYAHEISPRVFELEYGSGEPPEVSLSVAQLEDNHFSVTAVCDQQLTAPSLELPGAVVGEVQMSQIAHGWQWEWDIRVPQGVSAEYTVTFRAPELDPQTVSFEYVYSPPRPRGAPREPYSRRAFIYHPIFDYERFTTLAAFCYQHKYTLMSSADDGGIGDLDERVVVVISPKDWGEWTDPETGELQQGLNARWYELYYPGIRYFSVEGDTTETLRDALQALDLS